MDFLAVCRLALQHAITISEITVTAIIINRTPTIPATARQMIFSEQSLAFVAGGTSDDSSSLNSVVSVVTSSSSGRVVDGSGLGSEPGVAGWVELLGGSDSSG